MTSKGIFESKYGSRERGATWQNITENLNNCKEFATTARSLRDHFTTFMKRFKSKTRREVKGTGRGDEELSKNEQLFEDLNQSRYSKKTVLYRNRGKKLRNEKKSNRNDLERSK